MRITSLLSVTSAGLGTALATPRNLRVRDVSVLGTGCPYGSADVKVDPSNTALDIRLSEYVVRSGPNTMAADWRKNCKLTLNLEYDAGFQFSTLSTSVKGFAYIPSGAQGQCQNTVDFTGSSSQANYGITLKGSYDGPFSLSANPDIVTWSPCGGSTAILNVNTQCWISPTEKKAIIDVDRISSKLTVRVDLQWRNC
ncbi:hypothetical protein N657DRAFT_624883 [Parathielavia appendiculata]|uniref:Secreted protein n=1 Tax=Parathielavia appendiculata TaxID=2587402 RepID=A0AAN6TU44_9PEZI|nr:hypothetical protein N657DRAFT_624883 [Parathielavia appendiculata]